MNRMLTSHDHPKRAYMAHITLGHHGKVTPKIDYHMKPGGAKTPWKLSLKIRNYTDPFYLKSNYYKNHNSVIIDDIVTLIQ